MALLGHLAPSRAALQGRSQEAWKGLGSILLCVTGGEALYAGALIKQSRVHTGPCQDAMPPSRHLPFLPFLMQTWATSTHAPSGWVWGS